jgi:hypothetical protein
MKRSFIASVANSSPYGERLLRRSGELNRRTPFRNNRFTLINGLFTPWNKPFTAPIRCLPTICCTAYFFSIYWYTDKYAHHSPGRKEFAMNHSPTRFKIYLIQWWLGLLSSMIGAYLLWTGKLLGEDITSFGRTLGVIGIIVLGTASAAIRRERK